MSDTYQCSHGPFEKSDTGRARLFSEKKAHEQGKRVVLVMVDDDEDDCILVAAALKESCAGCNFRCIQDGVQLMEYLQGTGRYQGPGAAPSPDLILLDLNMPRMNGRQVLERLKTDPRFRAIPVIVLTTSTNPEDVYVCYELGANSYIAKQSSFDGLLSAIKTICEYWVDVATLPPKIQTQPFNPERGRF